MFIYILLPLLLFILAFIFAAAEIEEEGPKAWAQGFPTWRRTKKDKGWLGKFSKHLKRPITGYHFFFFMIPFFLFHIQFIFAAVWNIDEAWTWDKELYVLSIYCSWCIIWDFLWFILNPHFTLKKFKKEFLFWYEGKWIWRISIDYLGGFFLSIIFVSLRALLDWDIRPCAEYAEIILVWILLLILTQLLSRYYHNWYWKMRELT